MSTQEASHGKRFAAHDHCLSPVRAGRIVAEVLIGLLRADPASYLSVAPDWAPTLPAAGPSFGLADLLTLGVHQPLRPA